ncbi:uncharacterized protein LOC124274359 isoform X2 [Haliotis rubra]|uniref:uncharacterized protein LOC124274359 isoform X2 n=1 Tax=Haliotis rubra TaxID=36100 RepID=UPI001EE55089|nr:uncharacterized protein LOC124274359 isoform X2 [Haliotis rubra]
MQRRKRQARIMAREIFWIVLLSCAASIGADPDGYTVFLIATNSTPTEGNTTVGLNCTYTGNVTSVTIDRMRKSDVSWKSLARFNEFRNISEYAKSGLDLKDRSQLSMESGSVSLYFYSMQCEDTANYKCQVMPTTDERRAIYDTTSIDVLDKEGEVCGAQWHMISALQLSVILLVSRLLI